MRKAVLTAALLACAPVLAQTRTEVPIREVPIDDGQRRYTIMVKVGGTAVEAGLDTGSTGLRILPGTLAADDAHGTGESDTYGYETGTQFDGEVGKANLAIGDLSGPASLQMIKTMKCRRDKPDCPASKVDPAHFGIQGNGLPGRGFRAIIGINMAGADVDNPLTAIGAKQWIVELPRDGAGAPGKLILNPGAAEMAGYARLTVNPNFRRSTGGLHDSVAGCLINAASKGCGAVMLDTGAPGIRLVNGGMGDEAWAAGTQIVLGFYDPDGTPRASERLIVGLRSHGSRLSFQRNPHIVGTAIFAGLSPYFAFDVLYDPARGEVGLKPRPPEPGAPDGALVEQK